MGGQRAFPIRVLQIGMVYNMGGIQTFIMNHYRNIDKEKIQFDFICYDVDEAVGKWVFNQEIQELGGEIFFITHYKKNVLKYIKELKRIIKDNKYSIIHFNMNTAGNIIPLIVAKKCGVGKIIAHAHNSQTDKNFAKKTAHNVMRHLIQFYATEFFACSMSAAEWFYSKKIRKSNHFHIIYNGIDTAKYKFDYNCSKKIKQRLGIDDKFVIGFVGVLRTQKNCKFMLDILKAVLKQKTDSVLLLVGDGEQKEAIVEYAKQINVFENVIITGFIENTNEYYQAIDVFLMPSLYEGLPFACVEAQAAGLTCILSDVISDEVILTDKCHKVSLKESADVWANKVLSCSSERSYDCKVDKFDIKYSAKMLENLYIY